MRDMGWAATNRGGKIHHTNFGGDILWSDPSKTTFGGLRKWDCSGRCPLRLREMTGRHQMEGAGNRIIGSKNVLGDGSFGMASPPLSFPPPFAAL